MNHFYIDNTPLTYKSLESDVFKVSSVSKEYTVEMTDESIKETLKKTYKPGNIAVIDGNVFSLYFSDITEVIDPKDTFVIHAAEENKTVETALQLVDFLSNKRFNKKNNMIVIGGGIVQDVSSFVGACYKRGFDWTFLPTTLLSQCDSCIGSKSGLNYKNSKNQLGMFSPPSEIKINTNFLKTLSEEEIKSGLGEILKVCQMAGEKEVKFYLERVVNANVGNFSEWKTLIKKSLMIKKSIIEHDELEKHERRALNYGHTVGHAVEIVTNYKIPHGQAVALGMYVSNSIVGNFSDDDKKAHLDLITSKSIIKGLNVSEMREVLITDKKSVGEQIMMVWVDRKEKTSTMTYVQVDDLLSKIKNVIEEITV